MESVEMNEKGLKYKETKLRKIKIEEKQILANLLEKYLYEFSQYTNEKVNNLGQFDYAFLDNYWTETDKRWAYFIEVDNQIAGFVLVKCYAAAIDRKIDFSMAEFFVMYPYRSTNVAKNAFFETLNLHKGNWEIFYHPHNIRAANFWQKSVKEYTKGNYQLLTNYSSVKYTDGTPFDSGVPADIIFFSS